MRERGGRVGPPSIARSQGGAGRGRGRGEQDRPRTVRVALLAGVLVLAGIALAVDARSREETSSALAVCAAQVDRAAATATRSVAAMLEYIRPTLSGAGPGLDSGLYALVAEQAAGSGGRLAQARERCDGVEVSWVHQELRARRGACLRRADAVREYLDRVAADGRVAALARPERVPGC